MKDSQYNKSHYRPSEMEHQYGPTVHILENPYLQAVLTKFCSPKSIQPEINRQVEVLYDHMIKEVANSLTPRTTTTTDTRMKSLVAEGAITATGLDLNQKFVTVSLARAGTWPSHICFDRLNQLFNPEGLRQDHFYLNRKVNENDEVIGVDATGSKIGGDQEKTIVLFPDPMAATGGSLCHVVDHYKKNVEGKALKYVAMHLIITPEYIKRMQAEHPDVEIYSLRLDRGLSTNKALESIPGTFPEEERGLTDKQYIVPGAGGVGEVLNNSFV